MAAIYCWGSTTHGQLGLGDIKDEQIFQPRKMDWDTAFAVRQVACGRWHTLFLTENGKVYSCGSNDNDPLSRELPSKRPRMSPFKLVVELLHYAIKEIRCGERHSVALNEWGQLFTWGSNEYGQLGINEIVHFMATPKIIKRLLSKQVVQVATGRNHNMALTDCGELYTWGMNTYGQLGLTSAQGLEYTTVPQLVNSLRGIPIASIACGGNHSFMVSRSGGVFGWGLNGCGQLGLNDDKNRCYPTQLKTLRSLSVRYIACGDEYSVFLTNEGGVFTCGSGVYGQLGHGTNSDEMLPRMVVELMGSTVTQVVCGSRHTLALVPSQGRVYGFGLDTSGQLGKRLIKTKAVPQIVMGPWGAQSSTGAGNVIRQLFAGGDHSMAMTTTAADNILPPVDYRIYETKSQIVSLTAESALQCEQVDVDAPIDLDLFNSMELIFRSQACLNGSFLLGEDRHSCCTSKNPGVDLAVATTAFSCLRRIENESLKQIIWDKVTNDLVPTLSTSPPDVEALRIYLTLPLYHEFVNPKNYEKLHTPFSDAVRQLDTIPGQIVRRWWSVAPAEWFEQLVTAYRDVIAHIIIFKVPTNPTYEVTKRMVVYTPGLKSALEMLVLLYDLNRKQREHKLKDDIFLWPELVEYVDLHQNYVRWVIDTSLEGFNICKYPFLFNASAKAALLQTDQSIQMHNAMQNATYSSSQYLILNVTRENLVQDTMREIMHHSKGDLKKPLKVKFQDEEAEDAGGVRKEFFLLLLKDLIDPKYGMFKEFENSRAVWFSDMTFETEEMYFLIGVICGLAIYNFTIINLPFPLALYKKLLSEPVDLRDLKDLSPELAKSMESILEYDAEDFEEVFNINFEISRDIFGESKTEPLKPNGNKLAVTLENRKEFVDLYVDFVFNKAVQMQFTAFHDGFMKVCRGQVLLMFKPDELMAMVVGNEEYDWHAFEMNCGYKNGYTSSDKTVRWFWEVFHELPAGDKKKFLQYLTGSDRIPIQGMKAIKVYIQPTQDDRFLPVAHTCFNLLDLPRYQTKERLKDKLKLAIQQTHGFHLV